MSKKNEVTTYDENLPAEVGQYMIMKREASDIMEILKENLGESMQLSANNLTRVKVPSGGGTTWTLPTINGEVDTKELNGIIVCTQTTRAYWETEYDGGSEPPVCVSNDGLTGIGNPGGNCLKCPLNEFGTADDGDGAGKACNEMRLIFLVMADEFLPIVVKAPAMSLRNAQDYLTGLSSAGNFSYEVYTKLTLMKDKNKRGQDYSKIVFTKVGDVEDPDRSKAYAKAIRPYLTKAARELTAERNQEEPAEAEAY